MAQYAGLAGSAAVAARLAGRGDDPAAGVQGGTITAIEREGKVLCVSMTAGDDTVLGRLSIRLSARACALDEAVGG